MTKNHHIVDTVWGTENSVTFTGKEWCKSQWLAQRGLMRGFSETGYSYFGARYYDSDLSGLFLSVDPMSDKYPSISPYAYCALNPVKLVDPDGREIVDPPFENHSKNDPVINIDGHIAIIQQGDGTSRAYDLSDHKQTKEFVSDVNDLLTKTGSITGFVGITGEKSKSTFRLTNSKGKLDFKFYPNGWKGMGSRYGKYSC